MVFKMFLVKEDLINEGFGELYMNSYFYFCFEFRFYMDNYGMVN